MTNKDKLAMIVAEFMGTAILVMVVYSMVARTTFPLFAALGAGATLALLSVTMGWANGGVHLNPAVTVSLWTQNRTETFAAIVAIAAQFLGAFAACALLGYFLGRDLQSTAGRFDWKILTAEAIGAGVFIFGVAAAAYHQSLSKTAAAVVAGSSLFLGIMVASIGSAAVINPAVAVGIQSWNWAYAAGPVIGGIVGVSLYGLLFAPTPAKRKK